MNTLPDMLQLLERATQILPVSGEDLIYKGIAAGVAERMMALRKAAVRLQEQHGSLEALEEAIQAEGVPPDDHSRYTDLLEWRAIHAELRELQHIFETL